LQILNIDRNLEQIGNHDHSRVATRFTEDRIDIMNILVTMLKGTCVTYYGEEIGMTDSCAIYAAKRDDPAMVCTTAEEKATFSDAWFRSPMQWSNDTNSGFTKHATAWIPLAENYKTLNVAAQEGKDKSHLEIYRSLLKLRKNHHALMHDDKFEIKALTTNSFGFIRCE
jgi:alpha-glucosidase